MSLPIVPILSEDLQAPPLQQLGHGRNQAPPDWEALKHQFRGRNDALGARRRTSHSNEPDDSLETNRSPPPIRHVISEYSWPLKSHDPVQISYHVDEKIAAQRPKRLSQGQGHTVLKRQNQNPNLHLLPQILPSSPQPTPPPSGPIFQPSLGKPRI